jgi:hypothetical protein
VDCVTYEITSDYPLRLGQEIVTPGGMMWLSMFFFIRD